MGSLYKSKKPKSNKFVTRDGFQILLSKNLQDSITVMVIFCRKEYGKVIPGSVVIDVGANIGAFSVYAARCGAKKIYAFEPNKESYEILLKNIKINNLEDTIIPYNLAVGPVDGQLISIPKESSPYNTVKTYIEDTDNYDIIESISLPTFIKTNNINKIDFLKMDCEGAEYPIIYSMKEEDFRLITTFRLENHNSQEKEKLILFFKKHGLKNTHEKNLIIWFDR